MARLDSLGEAGRPMHKHGSRLGHFILKIIADFRKKVKAKKNRLRNFNRGQKENRVDIKALFKIINRTATLQGRRSQLSVIKIGIPISAQSNNHLSSRREILTQPVETGLPRSFSYAESLSGNE